MNYDPKIAKAIEAADARLNAREGRKANHIAELWRVLTLTGRVEVGWRESCGTTDPTAFIRREWLKVVKAAEKAGIKFSTERVKHGNGWATKSGGFWSSEIVRIQQAA